MDNIGCSLSHVVIEHSIILKCKTLIRWTLCFFYILVITPLQDCTSEKSQVFFFPHRTFFLLATGCEAVILFRASLELKLCDLPYLP